jgi:hypothetical protein
VSPVLMSLSASHNHNRRKHVRALAICAFLVVACLGLMSCLWTTFSVGTWFLAVSAFCIEASSKHKQSFEYSSQRTDHFLLPYCAYLCSNALITIALL